MNSGAGFFQLPESVKRDARAYRQGVDKFLQGQTRPMVLQAYRVPHGIYEQRQTGQFMVRVRVPAGMVFPEQMKRLAKLSQEYGDGVLHITTRQDIQIHKVKLEHTPDVVEGLLEVGMSSRGGGGNTVRNITSCPRAGLCADEVFDIRPDVVALTEYLLDFASSFNLPRKYKIVFSGCSQDCALASVADLGFFAQIKDGTKGFAVYAGGGLGSNPRVAVKIEDFVAEDEVFQVAEAIKRVFDAHGDRSNKHRARLRYVLKRVGEDEFIKLYKTQLAQVHQEGLKAPAIRPISSTSNTADNGQAKPRNGYEDWRKKNVLAEKEPGEFTVNLRLSLGDISAKDLAAIGSLLETTGEGFARTTQSQDLLLGRVREADLPFVFERLGALEADVVSTAGPKLVACAGAVTCRLGLCRSRGLAQAIQAELEKTDWPVELINQAIRISGCPNCCGQHNISAIGLQGRAKRMGGKLVPCYVVLSGGVAKEAKAQLGQAVGIVPAKNVPVLISKVLELLASRGIGEQSLESAVADAKEDIEKLTAEYSEIPSIDEQPDVYRDFGCSSEFSLAGRGPGECGAGVMDVIRLDIDQAKEALGKAQATSDTKGKSDALYGAIVASARALLITRGLEPRKDRQIFAAFDEHLIQPGWVGQEVKALLDQAFDYRLSDADDIGHLEESVARMLARMDELFLSLNAQLNFGVEPVSKELSDEKPVEGNKHVIDLRGMACPLNFVKAKLALEKIDLGQVLEVLLDDGEPVKNVPLSFTEQGQEVVDVAKQGEHFCVKVRRVH